MQRQRLGRYRVTLAAVLKIALAVLGSSIASTGAAAGPQPAPHNSQRVLADGTPPLTQEMVDRRIAIWEAFLEITINPEQRNVLQRVLVQAWERGDEETIRGTLDDFKQKDSDIPALRAARQSAFVDDLRARPNDAMALQLLECYDSAHPERKDFMRAHGMGDLVGKWKRTYAILPQTNPNSHEVIGVSATDSLTFTIFSDGHFKHFWAHSHCGRAYSCCSKYSTDVNGTVSMEGGNLVLKAESGTQLFDAPCSRIFNSFGPIQSHEERLAWAMRRGANNAPALCVAAQPFDPWQQGPGQTVCYERN
jgi:hypothetical protein